VAGPISIEIMAADMIRFIEQVAGGPVALVGFSAGAMVALRVAVRRPDLVTRLVSISGAFDINGMMFKPTAGMTMPAPVVAAYGEVTPDGVDHFAVVQEKIAKAAAEEAGLRPSELGGVTCPALVVCADDDIVTLEHTAALFRGLPDAQLAIVPGTSHLLLREKPTVCFQLVFDFLTQPPARRLMPVSRA
jgi:pimeloyl-ACP methyl ester carboxylesterase